MTQDVDFEVRCERRGAGVVVVVRGELDLASSDELRAALDRPDAAAPVVVLDLRGVTFIDSTALGILAAQQRRAREDGFELAVAVAGARMVERVFELSGLDAALRLVDAPEALLGP